MSEFTPSEEGRKEQLSALNEDILKLKSAVVEAAQSGNTEAEEEAQGRLNTAKYKRFELADDSEREAILMDAISENADSYEELAEVGVPVGIEQLLFDAFGEPVEIPDELRDKTYQTLEQYDWWQESEHYDE